MDLPEWDARLCGLSVRTDSLTVLVDLSRLPVPVSTAFRAVLKIPRSSSATTLPYSNASTVARAARAEFESLYQGKPDQALQFVTLLSAFFHETRHVHDLRATWIGAELLANEYKVYAGVRKLIGDLSAWQRGEISRRILMPLCKTIDKHSLDSSFPSEPLKLSLAQSDLVSNWWCARSSFRTIPGTSIQELFETLGFIIQIEWIAATFGQQVANEVSRKTLGDEPFSSPYFRPLNLLATICNTKGVKFDPEPHDTATLIVASLNVSGLHEAFSNGKPSEFHPGAWFDRFANSYANLLASGRVHQNACARVAVNLSLSEAINEDLSSRITEASERITRLRDELLGSFVNGSLPIDIYDEALLLASELAIDFRDLQRIMSIGNSYFIPVNYVDLMMNGSLHSVYTRVIEEDGNQGDFLTPSHIPTNHVGGIRHASLNSQKMRFLLRGRELRNQNAFEESVFQALKGAGSDEHGLKFRFVK